MPSLAYGVTETYSNGDRYVGDIKNGMRHGFGTYYWTNEGVSYKGKWKKDEAHGQGIFTYSDGGTYEGKFKMGVRHGEGILTNPQGERVLLKYKNGKVVSNTKLDSLPSDPWNIGRVDFDYYYTSYDLCTNVTNSFVEMVDCGKFYRLQSCKATSNCSNEGNMFMQYSDTLALGVKKRTMNETEAMLKFIEFRASLTNKGTGTGGLGITKFNNFLQFQNTVRGITGSSGW